jgi:nucleotide-sensitive chloride channel 1A
MSLTTITTAPSVDDFTPFSEHHEQTPGSFFAAKPVLHLQAPASKLQVSKDELKANEAIKALVATTDDAAVDAEGLVEIQDIDVWVTSRYVPNMSRRNASPKTAQHQNKHTNTVPLPAT